MNKLTKILSVLGTFIVTTIFFVTTVSAQSYDYTYRSSDAAVSGAGLTVSILVYCCFCLIGFAILAAVSYYVYKDAVKNEVDNAILWAILTFFFTVIGLLVYFLAIRPDAIKKKESRISGGSSSSTPTSIV